MRKTLIALSLAAATAPALAADYSDDIHANDYTWLQFNLMYAFNELPADTDHEYLEMEFGGRSGIFDLYGYVDLFNLTNDESNDKAANDRMFMKFAPRLSLDAATGIDFSYGALNELYIASEFTIDGGSSYGKFNDEGKPTESGFNSKIGIGSDFNVPFMGKMALNLYGVYDMNAKDWNGYQISTNWFKPLHTFDNGSFIAYQGYIDYQFGMKGDVSHGGAMFNGFYWHTDRYALGYGLKGYSDVYGIDGATGVAHYINASYKF
uniref:nucleoside-specific channel-forming Tsx family protein n=1 Tax=Thaumasiovibrio occultus TaxID=1891184 RepID=UPI000B36311F|nr:outer membrane protein OmpK [Thaumasiovibrio occultus]